MADGRKVKNTAYKPKSKQSDGSVDAKASKDELRSDFGSPSQSIEPGDVSETLNEGFDSLESILDVLEQNNTPSPDDHGNIHGLARNLYETQQGIVNNLYEVLHGYGIDGISSERVIMPLIGQHAERYSIDIESTDPNMPSSISTYIQDTLDGIVDHTTLEFKEGNTLGVRAVQFSREDYISGTNTVITYTTDGDRITEFRYPNGDIEHFEDPYGMTD